MDPHVARLRELFLAHPAWLRAAAHIRDGCESRVYFSHVEGEYRLVREGGASHLLEGAAADPDFAFRFTPRAIDRLAAVESDRVADFAVELFETIVSDDPDLQVGLRVIAGFGRLLRRGYLGLLLKHAPRLLSYGRTRGVTNLGELRKFLRQSRASDPRWANL
jgi:hypothetical protein